MSDEFPNRKTSRYHTLQGIYLQILQSTRSNILYKCTSHRGTQDKKEYETLPYTAPRIKTFVEGSTKTMKHDKYPWLNVDDEWCHMTWHIRKWLNGKLTWKT